MLANVAASPSSAETWHVIGGRPFEGTIRGVHGDHVLISDRLRFGMIRIADLPDEELSRVADHLVAHPRAPVVAWSESRSKIAKEIQGRLQVLSGGEVRAFDPGDRLEPEYYLIYFSAHWCGPCRRFTPRLVEEYHRLKHTAPDRFELIFVSNDHGAREQEKYVREVGMPWPFVRYRALGAVQSLQQWAGNGIPCLVLIDREGNLIFHSYNGDHYVGPDDVLLKFESLLTQLGENGTPRHEKVHRLEVLVHTRSRPADGPPRGYWVRVDPELFPTLIGKTVSLGLEIGVDGRVSSVQVDESVSDIDAMRLRQVALGWQFLPAIKEGVPVAAKVRLPFRLEPAAP